MLRQSFFAALLLLAVVFWSNCEAKLPPPDELEPIGPIRCLHLPMCPAPPPHCLYSFRYDNEGCPVACILDCMDNPFDLCPLPRLCPKKCPHGYVKDARGCQTCVCKPGPVCDVTLARCSEYCPYGQEFITDFRGCKICRCKPRPVDICHKWLRCDPERKCPNSCRCWPNCRMDEFQPYH